MTLDPAAEPRGDREHGVAAETVEAWGLWQGDRLSRRSSAFACSTQRSRSTRPGNSIAASTSGDLLGRQRGELGEGPDPERVQPLLYLAADALDAREVVACRVGRHPLGRQRRHGRSVALAIELLARPAQRRLDLGLTGLRRRERRLQARQLLLERPRPLGHHVALPLDRRDPGVGRVACGLDLAHPGLRRRGPLAQRLELGRWRRDRRPVAEPAPAQQDAQQQPEEEEPHLHAADLPEG